LGQGIILVKKLVVIAGSMFAVSLLLFYIGIRDFIITDTFTDTTIERSVIVVKPVQLRIPSIGVNAPIEYVGLDASGTMETPKNPQHVGWFYLGPRPGETGSAVIAGHRNWANGKTAIFDDLYKVRVGDHIEVVDSQGKISPFVVQKTVQYDKDAIVPEVFFSSKGIHLNLIVCAGDWNQDEHTSEARRVIYADLEK
jgi:sortase A